MTAPRPDDAAAPPAMRRFTSAPAGLHPLMDHATAARAWPTLALPRDTFAAYLAVRTAADPAHAGDLYLACATLAAVPGAVDAFATHCLAPIERHLRRIDAAPAFLDEVRQAVATRLLVDGRLA